MAVCKFFQQGYCRFGQSCKFDHIYGSKYNYQAPAAQKTTVGTDQLVNQVKTDTEAALKGGQWLLTVYAPFKEKANMMGFTDYSFEEIRYSMYEAKSNNTLAASVNSYNTLLQDVRNKFTKLLEPDATILKTLLAIYNGQPTSNPFEMQTSGFGSTTNPASIFGAAAAQLSQGNATQTPFGNSPSVFSNQGNIFQTQPGLNQVNSSVFEPTNQQNVLKSTEPQSIFAAANQSLIPTQQQNVFANSNTAGLEPQSIFSAANQNFTPTQQQNVFQTTNTTDPQPQSIFAAANENLKQSNTFANNGAQQQAQNVYSEESEISALDMAAFKSSSFKLGQIPEVPPPLALC